MATGKKVLAIVGRPNVGKSTLFNRLLKGKRAIVDDVPGVTRDRIYADAVWDGVEYILVDTGGFMPDAETEIARGVHLMAEVAIEEADAIIFLMDVRDGLNPNDKDVFDFLRRRNKSQLIYPVVNKVDGPKQENDVYEFYSLGVEKIYPISAQHNLRVGDLLDDVIEDFKDEGEREQIDIQAVKIAIVGRPNVGKSSILNRIIGYNRVLVHEDPGTTTDSVDTLIYNNGNPYLFIDTAGIRRKSRISLLLEKFSVLESLKSIDRTDIALIIIDATLGVTDQDSRVAGFVHDKGKGSIILVNKWDLIEKDETTAGKHAILVREDLKKISYAPILFTSALSGKNLHRIFETAEEVLKNRERRIPTAELNNLFEKIKMDHHPGLYRGKMVKLYYITQIEKSPPTFLIFTNHPKGIKPAYERYIVNRLREEYDFSGTPLRIFFRKRERDTKNIS